MRDFVFKELFMSMKGKVRDGRLFGKRRASASSKSVVKRIQRRIEKEELSEMFPPKFAGDLYGFLRVPVVGKHGLQFLGRLMDGLRRRGKSVNGFTLAELLIDGYMEHSEVEHLNYREANNA